MLASDVTLPEVQEFFARDRFATEAMGARISQAGPGYAVCQLDLTHRHLNAMGHVMGGVMFTLADFALAVACNIGEQPTVSISNTINFLSASKGNRLIAECRADRSGRSIGFYTVDLTDELGNHVARMMATCSRRPAG